MRFLLRAVTVGPLPLLLITVPTELHAQPRASERASVSQTVDGTIITVDYARPGARGREIFGGVVPWGHMWTPGANWATTLETSRDISIADATLAAGKYSIWLEPSEEDAWQLHFHENPRLFHTTHPQPGESVLSIVVVPEERELVERLTFSFPDVRRDGTTLLFAWGDTRISVPITVESTFRVVELSDEEMEPYLGRFEAEMNAENNPAFPVQFYAVDGTIRGGSPGGADRAWFQLLPRENPHEFQMVFLGPDGEVNDVPGADEGGVLTFTVSGGRAVSFTATGAQREVWVSGERSDP